MFNSKRIFLYLLYIQSQYLTQSTLSRNQRQSQVKKCRVSFKLGRGLYFHLYSRYPRILLFRVLDRIVSNSWKMRIPTAFACSKVKKKKNSIFSVGLNKRPLISMCRFGENTVQSDKQSSSLVDLFCTLRAKNTQLGYCSKMSNKKI
jgi:hypothetical protein